MNVIVAADGLLIPAAAEPIAVAALDTLLAAVERVRARMSARGRIVGLLLSNVDPHRGQTHEIADRLAAEHREKVFRTEIRHATALSDAFVERKPITAAPRSPSAEAFRRLAGELLHRLPALRH